MPKIGDHVRYLNSVGGGKIVRIEGTIAWVDDEGFETPVLLRECVVVRTAEEDALAREAAKRNDPAIVTVAPKQPASSPSKEIQPQDDLDEVEETDGGNVLNITVGFEPTERSRLSQTDFDASLVNDSNYFLYFAFSSRDDDSAEWVCRYAGMVEPNTELFLGTFARSEIALFDNLCFQYIAFKRGREFEMKPPASVQMKVDTTKFFKLHCFRANKYYENEVLAFPFVENDVPAGSQEVNLEPLLRISVVPETKNVPRPDKHRSALRKQRSDEPLVVDLHMDSLLDSTAGMSAADILNYQIDTFRRIMDENLKKFGRKIIFIHGKGEGVLRQALGKELSHRYRGHDVQDASFREYGYGATQVTIRQHPDNYNNRPKR